MKRWGLTGWRFKCRWNCTDDKRPPILSSLSLAGLYRFRAANYSHTGDRAENPCTHEDPILHTCYACSHIVAPKYNATLSRRLGAWEPIRHGKLVWSCNRLIQRQREREREKQDKTRKGGNSRLEGNLRWNGSTLRFYMGPLRGFIARALRASDVEVGTKEEREGEAGVAVHT